MLSSLPVTPRLVGVQVKAFCIKRSGGSHRQRPRAFCSRRSLVRASLVWENLARPVTRARGVIGAPGVRGRVARVPLGDCVAEAGRRRRRRRRRMFEIMQTLEVAVARAFGASCCRAFAPQGRGIRATKTTTTTTNGSSSSSRSDHCARLFRAPRVCEFASVKVDSAAAPEFFAAWPENSSDRSSGRPAGRAAN